MKASDILIKAICNFEGCKLKAYICPAGVLTIGYGHTKNVKKGQIISENDALKLLIDDIRPCENAVNRLQIDLKQGQFDALVDFVYNLGETKLLKSTLLKLIRRKESTRKIQNEFNKWVYASGKELPGLVVRRKWEAKRWVQD